MKKAIFLAAESEPLPTTGKREELLALLRRNDGYATMKEIHQATGWESHIVHGVIEILPIARVGPVYVLREDSGHVCPVCKTWHGVEV